MKTCLRMLCAVSQCVTATVAIAVACAFIASHFSMIAEAKESLGTRHEANPSRRYSDPFAYCAAFRTIDKPDERYLGPPTPEVVVRGLQKQLSHPALKPLRDNSQWRCMDGKVYACTGGANLPCQSKVDESREPTDAMKEYCNRNNESDFIPVVVTGRDTVYEWRCVKGYPKVERQGVRPDARGFRSDIWHEIPRTP